MKRNKIIYCGLISIAIVTISCFAQDNMEKRASQLRSALNFPTKEEALAANKPVFSDKDTVRLGNFLMKRKSTEEQNKTLVTGIEISDENGQLKAFGKIIESSSSENVHKEFSRLLVMSSLPMDAILNTTELRTNEVGEFCIVKKTFSQTMGKFIDYPGIVSFVRRGKAIILFSPKIEEDIRPIAKALDDWLLGQ